MINDNLTNNECKKDTTINPINYTSFIGRDTEEQKFRKLLTEFTALSNEEKICAKKGIYIYGDSGIGKSYFVKRVLTEMNYEIVNYDTSTVRNKMLFEQISSDNMSTYSVLSMLKKKPQKIAIIMDDINSMNGDKGSSISALIKIIRAKKTKKHKSEDTSINPIICIGNGLLNIGKKLLELVKTCHIIELKKPTTVQVKSILYYKYPEITISNVHILSNYIQNDFNKFKIIMKLYIGYPDIINNHTFHEIFHFKCYNNDTRNILKDIYNNNYQIEEHTKVIRDTEQTTIGLYWHENKPDILQTLPKTKYEQNQIYIHLLNNMCFADYIDRIMFQKQIWKFKEMSSLIKTFKTQHILCQKTKENNSCKNIYNFPELTIRFTKVLTKYNNEFNNFRFFQNIGYKLCLDFKDIVSFFIYLKHNYPFTQTNDNFEINPLESYNISCTDIKRVNKYLIKYLEESKNTETNIDLYDKYDNDEELMNEYVEE